MLLDARCARRSTRACSSRRIARKNERLLLRLAVGAATRAAVAVVSAARRRGSAAARAVVLRARRHARDHRPHPATTRRCSATRRIAGGARLAWPAPADPSLAIDDVEHDLSTLRELLAADDRASVRGHAHYLLGLNDSLRRSVVRRWARAQSRWRQQDGLVVLSDAIRPMLATQRLGARPYSVSALQKFTLCPYQFLLSAIYRLQPNQEPEPLQRLDPLTRGIDLPRGAGAVLPRACATLNVCRLPPPGVDATP